MVGRDEWSARYTRHKKTNWLLAWCHPSTIAPKPTSSKESSCELSRPPAQATAQCAIPATRRPTEGNGIPSATRDDSHAQHRGAQNEHRRATHNKREGPSWEAKASTPETPELAAWRSRCAEHSSSKRLAKMPHGTGRKLTWTRPRPRCVPTLCVRPTCSGSGMPDNAKELRYLLLFHRFMFEDCWPLIATRNKDFIERGALGTYHRQAHCNIS